MQNRRTPTLRSRRGAVLIVSMLFCAVIAISIASYLRLATTASRLSNRTFYQGVAMNVAETGLERALWSLNHGASNSWDGWDDVSGAPGVRRRTFDFGVIDGGAKLVVKVVASERVGGSVPAVLARAIVSPTQGAPIEKWVRVTLENRGHVAVGGLGREGIRASGNNVYFASWNSDPDNDPSTPYIPYGDSVKNDAMSLATIELDAELNSGNADVNGSASVGASSTDVIRVGSQGYIGPFGTASGTIDPDSVSTDFTADLEVVGAPDNVTYTILGSVTNDLTLPRTGDTPNADGVYYYEASQINLNGKVLAVSPGNNVVINVPNTFNAVSIGGNNGALQIQGTKDPVSGSLTLGSLKLYTPGSVSIAGQGSANEVTWTETTTTIQQVTERIRVGNKWVNVTTPVNVTSNQLITQPGQPRSLQIFGTRTDDQTQISGKQSISVSGNGNLSAVVYAPNADISAKGGGNAGFIYGSLIGASLTFTGNDAFYYDESLSNMDDYSRLGIGSWTELTTPGARASYASLMSF